jgi:hypothetical protein
LDNELYFAVPRVVPVLTFIAVSLWRHVKVLKLPTFTAVFVAPRVGPKAEVLVAVELLSIQAESQAQSLLALQPSDRKENTYLLLLGHHNLRPFLTWKLSKPCLLGFNKNLCQEPDQKLKTSYLFYQDKNTAITQKLPGYVYCVRSPTRI